MMGDFEKAEAIFSGLVFPAKVTTPRGEIEGFGITKRELFAAVALNGLLSNERFDLNTTNEITAIYAVNYADALLKELNK